MTPSGKFRSILLLVVPVGGGLAIMARILTGALLAGVYPVGMKFAEAALALAKLTAFLAIGLGGLASVAAGLFADRIGKAEITIIAMLASGPAALATAWSFGGMASGRCCVCALWMIE